MCSRAWIAVIVIDINRFPTRHLAITLWQSNVAIGNPLEMEAFEFTSALLSGSTVLPKYRLIGAVCSSHGHGRHFWFRM
eukprot:s1138_g13.t1